MFSKANKQNTYFLLIKGLRTWGCSKLSALHRSFFLGLYRESKAYSRKCNCLEKTSVWQDKWLNKERPLVHIFYLFVWDSKLKEVLKTWYVYVAIPYNGCIYYVLQPYSNKKGRKKQIKRGGAAHGSLVGECHPPPASHSCFSDCASHSAVSSFQDKRAGDSLVGRLTAGVGGRRLRASWAQRCWMLSSLVHWSLHCGGWGIWFSSSFILGSFCNKPQAWSTNPLHASLCGSVSSRDSSNPGTWFPGQFLSTYTGKSLKDELERLSYC